MSNRIDVQYATSRRGVPHARKLREWTQAALTAKSDMTIRVVGLAESRKLNRTWRGKDKPTNVLSFPAGLTSLDGHCSDMATIPYIRVGHESRVTRHAPLGDLVLCAPVIAREAREQGKPPQAHWAHMIVHGVLHLLGYDHVKSRDAKIMEALEVEILARLGYQDPYVSQ